MSLLNKVLRHLLTPERLEQLNLRERDGREFHEDVPLIEFYCEKELFDVIPKPLPAYKKIPKWFSKIPANLDPKKERMRDHYGAPVMTAKKCLPLLDGMSLGYVLCTSADFTVRTSSSGTLMEIINPPGFSAASQHDLIQLGGNTSPTYPGPALKFHNPWVIKTRPGWSTLFVPVLNHMDERFTCLAAAVETDNYPKQVNFPAVFHQKKDAEVTIPAGTPLVVAIPYRRADYDRDIIVRIMTEAEKEHIDNIAKIQHMRSHYYTHELRECPIAKEHHEVVE